MRNKESIGMELNNQAGNDYYFVLYQEIHSTGAVPVKISYIVEAASDETPKQVFDRVVSQISGLYPRAILEFYKI